LLAVVGTVNFNYDVDFGEEEVHDVAKDNFFTFELHRSGSS
jgi:hypothetical protein